MTKKSKSKNAVPKNPMYPNPNTKFAGFSDATASTIDKRKELLARVAGSIAAGLVTAPSPSIASPWTMATAAVDIAEEILKKAGILADPAVESSSLGRDVGVGAAS